jgi:hypothetical protein
MATRRRLSMTFREDKTMQFTTMVDVDAYREQQARARHLSWQAHNLCNTLCDKLYNWRPEPERAARLERVLTRARIRLARREELT